MPIPASGRKKCKVVAVLVAIKIIVVIIIFVFGKDYILSHYGGATPLPSHVSCDHGNHSFSTPQPITCPVTKGVTDLEALATNLPEVGRTKDQEPTRKPRVMCLLFTTPEKFLVQARAVNDTWARRCDLHRWFMTSNAEQEVPPDVVPMKIPEGRRYLVEKTRMAFRYAYSHINDADWFLKADDDTYVIVENLRSVLAHYNPEKPHYIGGLSADLIPHGYNGGGAGYSLSSAALRLIVEKGHLSPSACRPRGDFEDLEIGRCLASFQVFPVDTRDREFRLTFHADHPYKIMAGVGDARRTYTYRKDGAPYPKGIRTMSPHTVSFHSVEASFMYMYDFLLYDLERRHDFIHPDPASHRARTEDQPTTHPEPEQDGSDPQPIR